MKKNLVFKIIIILCLFIVLFPYNVTYAATSYEAGRYVASYAKWLCDTYEIKYVRGADVSINGNVLASNCVPFVNYVYSKALGVGSNFCPVPASNNPIDIHDINAIKKKVEEYHPNFELVAENSLDNAQSGDIIENYHHVMIYIGKCDGVDDLMANNGHTTEGLRSGLGSFEEYRSNHGSSGTGPDCFGNCDFRVWRLKDDFCKCLDVNSFNSGGKLLDGTKGSGKSNENMSNFYYNGIPDGKYSVTKGAFEVLVSAFKDLAEFFIGFIPNIIKMSLVGWTAIAESLVTSTIKTVTGGDDIINTPVTSTEIDSGDNITIEKIVFNEISIFDVNFFNFNEEDDEEEPKEEIPE